ncbi:unnamed protein product [Allacma fusca]|uniref:Uncharacterized protein n=1 Tax=Allacma fusca TaxID=39272 RepID=A0A8J2JV50_9HEXA|nr:unnamed protein product [Allacma fusca]
MGWGCNSKETNEIFCVAQCDESDDIFQYGRSEFDEVTRYENSSKRIFPGQFRCVTGNYLSLDIEDILVNPKTALVVYSGHLEYYWRKFKITMNSAKLKFAHNARIKDDNLLRRWNYLFTPLSWSKKYDYIGNRASVMMSSGLFTLWERWHKIRFLSSNSIPIDSVDDHIAKPLGLDSSVYSVMYAFLWSALCCTHIFVIEILRAVCVHHERLILRCIGQ